MGFKAQPMANLIKKEVRKKKRMGKRPRRGRCEEKK